MYHDTHIARYYRFKAGSLPALAALEIGDILEYDCHAQAHGEYLCNECARDNLLYVARAVCAGYGSSVSDSELEEYDGPETCGHCLEYLAGYADEYEYLETHDYCVSNDYLADFIARHWQVSYTSANKRSSAVLERAARMIVSQNT